MELVAEGIRNKENAAALGISAVENATMYQALLTTAKAVAGVVTDGD